MLGYVLHRKRELKISKIVFVLILSGMLFPYQMSILGLYKLIRSLGLMNHLASVIFINIACNIPFATFMFRSFVATNPEELEEAAKIDGAGVIPILTNIYLPLSKPILAVISVYTIVGRWNSWFDALIYLPKTEWQPLQLFLRRILVESTRQVTDVLDPQMAAEMIKKQMSGAQLKYAMIIFTTLPVLFTYPFFQKYFVKGVMLGSLKE